MESVKRIFFTVAVIAAGGGVAFADGVKWERAPYPAAARAAEEGAGTAGAAMAFVDATFGRGELAGVGGLTVVKLAPPPARTKSSINKSANGGPR